MSDASTEQAAALLAARAGLHFDAGAAGRLHQSLSGAATAAGVPVVALVTAMAVDAAALQAVVDQVTVQTSSFFREPDQITAFTEVVLPNLPPTRTTVWCAGCANGQEAYSLALALEAAGDERVSIVATDVSRQAVARAEAARYTDAEVAGVPASLRRHLVEVEGQRRWQVADAVRRRVRVQHHNLVRQPRPVDVTCTVVFCRNVLIYLPRPDVARLIRSFADLLDPDGWLFIGAAESLWAAEGFELTRAALSGGRSAFVHRPRAGPAATRHHPPRTPAPTRSRPVAPGRDGTRPATAATRPGPVGEVGDLLVEGEAALAGGAPVAAAVTFRRAAFLEPGNPIAHLHLGLALEAAGDAPAARRAFAVAAAALARADAAVVATALDGYDASALTTLLSAKMAPAANTAPAAKMVVSADDGPAMDG